MEARESVMEARASRVGGASVSGWGRARLGLGARTPGARGASASEGRARLRLGARAPQRGRTRLGLGPRNP
jgi:hypothetical protein